MKWNSLLIICFGCLNPVLAASDRPSDDIVRVMKRARLSKSKCVENKNKKHFQSQHFDSVKFNKIQNYLNTIINHPDDRDRLNAILCLEDNSISIKKRAESILLFLEKNSWQDIYVPDDIYSEMLDLENYILCSIRNLIDLLSNEESEENIRLINLLEKARSSNALFFCKEN